MQIPFRPLLLALACLLGACADRARAPEEPFQARFAVRGRWPGERHLRVFVEDEPGPVPSVELRAAVQAALATWQAAQACEFELVATRAEANVLLGWRRGAHEACAPFGQDPSVAHAGPVGPGTFVHLDAGRDWSESGLSLEQAVLHEFGHVLGLDHGPDEHSVMYPEPGRERLALGRSDRAALRALYGIGNEPSVGELALLRADGSCALVLPALAPPGVAEFGCYDSDGDGDDELLVWRVDRAPAAGGALWCFHFGPGPELTRTVGPLYGVSAPGARLAGARDRSGTRWLRVELDATHARVLRFDAAGAPGAAQEDAPEIDTFVPLAPSGDLDGDGQRERVQRR